MVDLSSKWSIFLLDEPLHPARARALVREILKVGSVQFSEHGLDEMSKDDLSEEDCVNVLRAGLAEPAELERGSWRYRFRTPKIMVVVAFRSELLARVVTAWRLK